MLTNIGNLLSKVGMFVKPDVGIGFPTLEYLMLTNIGNQSWNVCETWCWNKFSDVGMVDGYQCKTTDCCFPMLVIVYGIPTLVNITVYQHWKIMIGYQWHTNDTTIMFQWYHNIGKCFFFLPVAVYLQTVRYSKLICFAQFFEPSESFPCLWRLRVHTSTNFSEELLFTRF